MIFNKLDYIKLLEGLSIGNLSVSCFTVTIGILSFYPPAFLFLIDHQV
nr:MAG TPA: hypothetical protein [Caudoviricetes sp.]